MALFSDIEFFAQQTFKGENPSKYMPILENENVSQVTIVYENRGVADYIKTQGWINSFDSNGYTPLMAAIRNGAIITVGDLLLVEGIKVDIKNERGYNALHLLCYIRRKSDHYSADELIGMLLAAGANPDIKDNDGLTARDILRSIGCNERFGL